MDTNELALLLRFNRWADDTVLAALAGVDVATFTRPVASSHPSLRDTLGHILWAEELWLARWQGQSPQERLDAASFPDVATLAARWAALHERQLAFAAPLTGGDLARSVSYLNARGERWSYPLWQMVVHAINHSTYHRGQLTTLCRQLGIAPVWTDFLVFIDQDRE